MIGWLSSKPYIFLKLISTYLDLSKIMDNDGIEGFYGETVKRSVSSMWAEPWMTTGYTRTRSRNPNIRDYMSLDDARVWEWSRLKILLVLFTNSPFSIKLESCIQ